MIRAGAGLLARFVVREHRYPRGEVSGLLCCPGGFAHLLKSFLQTVGKDNNQVAGAGHFEGLVYRVSFVWDNCYRARRVHALDRLSYDMGHLAGLTSSQVVVFPDYDPVERFGGHTGQLSHIVVSPVAGGGYHADSPPGLHHPRWPPARL